MSVSKIDVQGRVRGKGEFTLELYRHLAPVTVTALLDELPLASRVMAYPGMVALLTGIKTGVEKQRMEFSKGEVAFFAANGSICIFLKNARSERPLNPIGRLDKGLESLEKVSAGDVVEIAAPAAQDAAVQT